MIWKDLSARYRNFKELSVRHELEQKVMVVICLVLLAVMAAGLAGLQWGVNQLNLDLNELKSVEHNR